MGCSTCHVPKAGWTFDVAGTNKHQVAITGANRHTVGNLKPPSNAYAPQLPFFGPDCPDGFFGYCEGNFWDGRAEGADPTVFERIEGVRRGATVHIGEEVLLNSLTSSSNPNLAAYIQYMGPIADQAYNPFLNPVEQNNLNQQTVCRQVESSQYADLFALVWDESINCSSDIYPGSGLPGLPYYEINHRRIAVSLAAYQMSDQVNSFTSKRDIALDNDEDGVFPLDDFTAQENLGHDLFYNRLPVPFAPEGIPLGPDGTAPFNVRPFPDLPVTNCSFCHSNDPGGDVLKQPEELGTEEDQLYTDRAYHNIGVPVNTEIPDTGVDSDAGLAEHTGPLFVAAPPPPFVAGFYLPLGFFKTPTLRNVCKGTGEGFPKAFAHNGYFKSVESIVHFYNTADVLDVCEPGTTEKDALKNNCWPAAAYPGVSPDGPPGVARGGPLVGNLGLSPEYEAAIVAYLHTLSDNYTPKAPKPYQAKKGKKH
jgi:cytochrome c peroxidase